MPAINLNKKGIGLDGPEFNAIAPNIQSNILKSHARDHVSILFLQFNGEGIKSWIKKIISQEKYVVSAMDQKKDTETFKKTGASKILANLYLSARGYEKLGLNTGKFIQGNLEDDDDNDNDTTEDEAKPNIISGNNDFVKGMKSKRVNKKLEDPDPQHWEPGYNTEIHAMVLLADDDKLRLDAETNEVKQSLKGMATVVKEESGDDLSQRLPNGKKIHLEHFGYADGISQPRYFTEDTKSSPFDLQPLSRVLVKDPFTDNNDDNYGSFLVYRKLEQDVDGFNKKVTELSENVNLNANQQGKITKEDFAGALVVGRFKDGTPLIKSDIALGQAPAFNDFKYENTDRQAHKCPFHAHIRKSNPRGQGILVQENLLQEGVFPTAGLILMIKKDCFLCVFSQI